jgi:hypothetical protein
MVLVNVRFLLARDGAVTVTVPPDRVVAAAIEPALVAACVLTRGRTAPRGRRRSPAAVAGFRH